MTKKTPTHKKTERPLTRDVVAERLGVSLRTVHRMMERGDLVYERDPRNGRVRIFPDSPALKNRR
jgi:excisionase family DNA binding protein